MPTYVARGSASDNIFEKVTAVRDKVSAESDYSYKILFKSEGKFRTLSVKIMQGVDHLWTRLLLV